jgi:hypothetical protein
MLKIYIPGKDKMPDDLEFIHDVESKFATILVDGTGTDKHLLKI